MTERVQGKNGRVSAGGGEKQWAAPPGMGRVEGVKQEGCLFLFLIHGNKGPGRVPGKNGVDHQKWGPREGEGGRFWLRTIPDLGAQSETVGSCIEEPRGTKRLGPG